MRALDIMHETVRLTTTPKQATMLCVLVHPVRSHSTIQLVWTRFEFVVLRDISWHVFGLCWIPGHVCLHVVSMCCTSLACVALPYIILALVNVLPCLCLVRYLMCIPWYCLLFVLHFSASFYCLVSFGCLGMFLHFLAFLGTRLQLAAFVVFLDIVK